MWQFFTILFIWCLLVVSPTKPKDVSFEVIQACISTKDFGTTLGKFIKNTSYTYGMYGNKYCVFLKEDDKHSGMLLSPALFERYFQSRSHYSFK